jgi:hypothetical protein
VLLIVDGLTLFRAIGFEPQTVVQEEMGDEEYLVLPFTTGLLLLYFVVLVLYSPGKRTYLHNTIPMQLDPAIRAACFCCICLRDFWMP